MRKTLTSAAMGVGLACGVFWVMDVMDGLQQAAKLADLQGQVATDWLSLTDLSVADGRNHNGVVQEPAVSWVIEPKRILELRVAVTTRDMKTGEPVCVGGTVTFIVQPSPPQEFTRDLSRIAGVERCDWPVGEYRSRFSWTMTDAASRVSKTLFQESEVFRVMP